jgi:hypothetical protein
MSACPHCLTDLPDIAVRGRRYRLRRRTHIKPRYIEAENGEYLYIQPIQVLVIESVVKRTALPKQPLTEAVAEQP